MKKNDICLLGGLTLCLILTLSADAVKTAKAVQNDTLRLHVISNSGSRPDKEIKTDVYYAVSGITAEICQNATDKADAVKAVKANLPKITKAANDSLKAQKAGYTARCKIEEFDFPLSEKESLTLPAGRYTALVIYLGEGEGKNWWTLIYPQIHTDGTVEYNNDSENTITQNKKYRVKLKTAEIRQKVKKFLTADKTPEYDKIE